MTYCWQMGDFAYVLASCFATIFETIWRNRQGDEQEEIEVRAT